MGKIKSSLAAIGQNWSMTQKVYKFLWAEVLGIVLATIIVLAVPVSIFINWLTAVLIAIPEQRPRSSNPCAGSGPSHRRSPSTATRTWSPE